MKPCITAVHELHSHFLFITFLSWTTVGVFPLLRVIQVGHSICNLLIQNPETSFSTWTGLHVHPASTVFPSCRRRGKSLQGFLGALRAELLPACPWALSNLLGNIPAELQRRFPPAGLHPLLRVTVRCDGGNLSENMACGGGGRGGSEKTKIRTLQQCEKRIWMPSGGSVPGAVKQRVRPSSPLFAGVTCVSVEPRITT